MNALDTITKQKSDIQTDKLSAIIVDDEFHGRENLKLLIETYCTEIEILACAESVKDATQLVKIHHPDVVFLDIEMPVLDGFDFVDEFENPNFFIVFVSAHEEFGIKAVKAGAVDYILKPVNIKELKQCVKKLLLIKNKQIRNEQILESDKLILPETHGFNISSVDEVIRLEADGCYTIVVIKNEKKKILSRTLKDFEATLPKEKFFRIHKSHLINLNFIKDYSNIDGYYVTMFDGSKLEISRRKVSEFTQKIKSVMKAV